MTDLTHLIVCIMLANTSISSVSIPLVSLDN